MASSSRSGSCGGGSNDEADWRSNRCFLPPWYERPKCMCRLLCIIDMWEWDDTTWVGRRYFKCADTDPNFYGMVVTSLFYSNFIQFHIFADLYVKFICFSPANFMNGLTWRSLRCGRRKYLQQKVKWNT
jgi:hypothetical protein